MLCAAWPVNRAFMPIAGFARFENIADGVWAIAMGADTSRNRSTATAALEHHVRKRMAVTSRGVRGSARAERARGNPFAERTHERGRQPAAPAAAEGRGAGQAGRENARTPVT